MGARPTRYTRAEPGASRGWPRIGRRRARVERDGQGRSRASDRRAGWQAPILAGRDQGPPERHALQEIAGLGDLAHVNGQAYLVAPVSPATIDALAAFSADGEDMKDEPVEDQGDDELALVECLRPAPARGRHNAVTPSEAPARPTPDLRVLGRLRAVHGSK